MCSIAMFIFLFIPRIFLIDLGFRILDCDHPELRSEYQLFFDMSFDSNVRHENLSFNWFHGLMGEWNLFLEKE